MTSPPKAGEARHIVTLHHLACSGGTIITKCLTTMPATMVLSEIHPDRTIQPAFHPIYQMLSGYRGIVKPAHKRAIYDHFRQEIALIWEEARSAGKQLIIRDHSHIDFAWNGAHRSKLVEVLSSDYSFTHIVTVRDPREVWISLRREGWFDGTPDDLCSAHLAMLDAFPGAAIFRYEDFAAEPDRIVEAMCDAAGIKFKRKFEKRLELVTHLTGDSGRKGQTIAPRPPKLLLKEDEQAFRNSSAYAALMQRLGYDPEFASVNKP